jgi:protease-4
MELVHLGDLLRSAGIHADFMRIGAFKSAIEELQDDGMSDPARAQREQLLDDVYRRMVWDLSGDLEVSEERVRALVDAGPYVAGEAVEAGLLDVEADPRDMDRTLEDAFGGAFARQAQPPDRARRRWGRARRVGVVVIDGEMIDGENLDVPLLELHATGGRTAVAALESLAADPAVAAIVVRIDTPGGSVLAADQLWRAIRRVRARVPVVASMGAVAASGGYYVASACDEIWASPSTMTGSIGVWFGKVDVQPLAERLGVHTEFLGRGAHAGAESLFRPFTPDERAMLAGKVRRWYRDFLDRVSEGRGMRATEVDAVARGRVWTGDRAVQVGLVDHLGGFYSALLRARQLGGLPEDADFDVRPSRPGTLLDYVLGASPLGHGAAAGQAEAGIGEVLGTLAPEARAALRAVWMLRSEQTSDAPMARMPLTLSVAP